MNSGSVGTVYLVGAGPGDPSLLTVKARRLLERADVVLHDSLVGEGIVELLQTADADVENVGKLGDGSGRWRQDDIHRRMRDVATTNDVVVRLKGGDPFVFGRGGEEMEYLLEQGIPHEVVPGVTSAVAAPELAGIPLTHRDVSSSFTVLTGHEAATRDDRRIEWEAFARRVRRGETIVILMGVKRLPEYVSTLRSSGVPQETPVAMIEKASWNEQRTVTGTISSIVDEAERAGVESPATVVIGDVVDVRPRNELRRTVDAIV